MRRTASPVRTARCMSAWSSAMLLAPGSGEVTSTAHRGVVAARGVRGSPAPWSIASLEPASAASRAGDPRGSIRRAVSATDVFRVLRRGDEPIAGRGVGRLELEHPALAVGVRVDEGGFLVEALVDRGDLAADRAEQLGHGLDRFDRTEHVVRGELGSDARQLDIDDVSELALGEIRDPDLGDAIGRQTHVLVVRGVRQVLRHVGCRGLAVGRSPRGARYGAPESPTYAVRE